MTRTPLTLLLALLLLALPVGSAAAQRLVALGATSLRVCPTHGAAGSTPDFTGEDCTDITLSELDPQGRQVWVRAEIDWDGAQWPQDRPIGLFISGKAASTAWLNGHELGSNGRPGPDRATEIPGRMDSVLYVPRERLRPGRNELVLLMSSQHGFLELGWPVHWIGLERYQPPTSMLAAVYAPSLVTLGVLVLGFVFFAAMAIRGGDREGSALISAMSLIAVAQLLIETSRGLYAYPYPMHDLRLVLIVACTAAFGLTLIAYLLHRFSGLSLRARLLRGLAVGALLITILQMHAGYDAKTLFAFETTILAGLAWCGVWVWQRKPGARAHLAVLAGLAALAVLFPELFIDRYFYQAIAGLLLFLFAQQAIALVNERRIRALEATRADRLEIALSQARQKDHPVQIELVSAGRTDYIATDRIAQLKAAGDYVEVHFENGQTSLYTGSLSGLEASLPPTFLRVHRSHIVNTGYVSALERDASGVGRLILSNGMDVPISRRILPKVRSALADAAQ
ncbi:LytTR family DNA-binding domain-containing protein [Maricaulis salignorans]|uniref:LytTr DNA-binding domain-containing protein n=1 Tax=Maricaulis salignorans TaxID=144026 RepID=A0A1G9T7C2_9PROT|nr:LytTR family DNA-binding domain-containing protein [Maricaulis salignorans]SDM43512.1 LytTr DNA-binding domain-containing protein [Maricaulis salignorans]